MAISPRSTVRGDSGEERSPGALPEMRLPTGYRHALPPPLGVGEEREARAGWGLQRGHTRCRDRGGASPLPAGRLPQWRCPHGPLHGEVLEKRVGLWLAPEDWVGATGRALESRDQKGVEPRFAPGYDPNFCRPATTGTATVLRPRRRTPPGQPAHRASFSLYPSRIWMMKRWCSSSACSSSGEVSIPTA